MKTRACLIACVCFGAVFGGACATGDDDGGVFGTKGGSSGNGGSSVGGAGHGGSANGGSPGNGGTSNGGNPGNGGSSNGGNPGTGGSSKGGSGTGGSAKGGSGGSTGGCLSAEECTDPTSMVCDPNTAKCVSGQCTGTDCPSGQICAGQVDTPTVGACYTLCDPLNQTGCAANQVCMAFGYDQTQGGCYQVGTGAKDGACSPEGTDINSGCVAGYLCLNEGSTYACRETCDFFGVNPTCAASGQQCWVGGFCTNDTVDSAAIGGTCDGSTNFCALVGEKVTGFCESTYLMCEKICRTAVSSDCPSGKTCQAVLSSGGNPIDEIGLCE
jgi:hypothetical protein